MSSSRVVPCPSCGALNGEPSASSPGTGDSCIRCGMGLGASPSKAPPRVIKVALTAAPRYVATKAFAALTSVVFAAQMALSLSAGHGVPLLSTKDPTIELRLGAMLADPALVMREPYRLLSAVFVHFGVLHFAMNGYAYLDLGKLAESFLGPGRFAVTFVAAGVGGFFATLVAGAVFGGPVALTAGASGAVFGLMGVVLGALAARKDARWKSFAMRAVLYSVLFGFAVNASGSGILVNNSAHVGGLAIGVVAGLLGPRPFPTRTRATRIANVLGALAFVASIAAVALAWRSPLPSLLSR